LGTTHTEIKDKEKFKSHEKEPSGAADQGCRVTLDHRSVLVRGDPALVSLPELAA